MPGIPDRNSASREPVQRREARDLGRRDAGLGVDETVAHRQHVERARAARPRCRARRRRAPAGCCPARSTVTGSVGGSWRRQRREVVAVGRDVQAIARDRRSASWCSAPARRRCRHRPRSASACSAAAAHHAAPPSCGGNLPDGARAHGHHDVAVADDRADRRRRCRRRRRRTPARPCPRRGRRAPARGRRRRPAAPRRPDRRRASTSASTVDRTRDEVLEQVAGARVAVRLEREHQPPAGKARARRRDRRRHLDRVVAVVVDQRERPAAFERDVRMALEAAGDAAELGERPRDRRVGHAGLAADRDRGQRVLHVVDAGEVELDGEILGARRPWRRSASGRRRSRRRSRAAARPRRGRR